jgi:hypothetical protein
MKISKLSSIHSEISSKSEILFGDSVESVPAINRGSMSLSLSPSSGIDIMSFAQERVFMEGVRNSRGKRSIKPLPNNPGSEQHSLAWVFVNRFVHSR